MQIKKGIQQTNANARKTKTYLGGGGNLPKVVSFTVQVVVDRHLVVPNTPSIGARTLVGWQEEVGRFA
jgi:hypothetical protein